MLVACSQHNPPALSSSGPTPDAGEGAPDGAPADATREADAAPNDATAADGAEGGDATAAVCREGATWTTTPATPWVTSIARFGGVSSDELTIAWTESGDGGSAASDAGAGPTIEIATRTDPNGTFGAPTAVALGSTAIADDRVGLAPSGNLVVAVAADRTTLVAFAGTAPTWSQVSPAQFAALAAAALDTGGSFYEPVLGGDGNLYYVLGSSAGLSLYQSSWDGQRQRWVAGVVLGTSVAGELLTSADPAHLLRPTGVSIDGRTLFYFDGALGRERAAWRSDAGGGSALLASPFSRIDDLPMLPEAAPNASCDRLYFVSSASVFTAQ
jgi:hypothetical protein